MKVTITLGEKALEFVTGIPEEELPGILSDVLERSLQQQVKEIPDENNSNDQTDILDQLRDLLKYVQPGNINTNTQDKSDFTNSNNTIIKELVKPHTPIDLGDDDLDEFDLMK